MEKDKETPDDSPDYYGCITGEKRHDKKSDGSERN